MTTPQGEPSANTAYRELITELIQGITDTRQLRTLYQIARTSRGTEGQTEGDKPLEV